MIEELLTVQVRKRQLQGDGVVVLDLIPVGGAKLPAFEAGAHVDIHIAPGLVRQYSLCSDPADSAVYRSACSGTPPRAAVPRVCTTRC